MRTINTWLNLKPHPKNMRSRSDIEKAWLSIMAADPDAVPEEIEETCVQCHEALAAVDRILKPVLAVSRTQLEDKVALVTNNTFSGLSYTFSRSHIVFSTDG